MSNIESGNNTKVEEKATTTNQWLVGCLAYTPVLTYGMLTGWLSPMSTLFKSENSPTGYILSEEVTSWMAGLGFLTTAFGVLLYTYLMNRFGRKPALLLLSLPCLIAILMKLTIINASGLLIARIFCGIAFGGALVIPQIYVTEIADENIRTKMENTFIMFEYSGILFVYIVGTLMEYSAILYLMLPLPLLQTFLTVWTPETPSYLVNRGKIWYATKAVSWLRDLKMNHPEVKSEISQLIATREELKDEPEFSYRNILRDEAKRNGAIITATLLTVQSAGGSYATIVYASYVLSSMGNSHTDFQAVPLGVMLVAGLALSNRIRTRYARRQILMGGFGLLAICYLINAVLLYLHKQEYTFPGVVPVFILSVAMFTYGCGVATMPRLIMDDMFTEQIKTKIWSICLVYTAITIFISVILLEPITRIKGLYVMYFLYASVNIFGVVFTKFYLPETRSRNVEEIEELLRRR